MTLTGQQIADAKKAANLRNPRHEHDDCIRMAYEWLDAQKTTKATRMDDWKHKVEHWCGRHITEDDVLVAALLHPRIEPQGYQLNISQRLVLPSFERLIGIGEAKKHVSRMDDGRKFGYASRE
jgi:hypothetical protein